MHEIIRKSKTAEKQKMLKREKEKFENKLSDKDLFRHEKRNKRDNETEKTTKETFKNSLIRKLDLRASPILT